MWSSRRGQTKMCWHLQICKWFVIHVRMTHGFFVPVYYQAFTNLFPTASKHPQKYTEWSHLLHDRVQNLLKNTLISMDVERYFPETMFSQCIKNA